jgi:Cu/Ag efflux protein CusF
VKPYGLLAILILTLAVACSKREQPRLFPMRGTVVRLDKKTNLASIHNEKIEGWMDEMTMEFPVEDRNEYKALRPGEKITATVNITSEGFWLTDVKERKGE